MSEKGDREGLEWRLVEAEKKIEELEASRLLMREEIARFREVQDHYRSIVDDAFFGAKVGIILLDAEFKVVWASRAIERFFGISIKEIIGKDKRQLVRGKIKTIFEDAREFEQKIIASYDDNSYVRNFECHVLQGPNRKERWLEHWSEPVEKGLFSGGRIETYIDITEIINARQRMEYLTKILHSIRKINQLIVTERSISRLLKGTCRYLVESGAYHSAWMALFDDEGRMKEAVEEGIGPAFEEMKVLLKKGGPRQCHPRKIRHLSEPLIVKNPHNQCSDCPLARSCKGHSAVRAQLRYKTKAYGIVVASVKKEYASDAECLELFKEVSGDIGFALHTMELDKLRRKTEEVLRMSEARYRMLYEYAGEPIFTYNNDLVLVDINSVACERIGISKEKLVGRNILELDVLHPDDVEKATNRFKELIEGKDHVQEKLRFRAKDGSYLLAEVIATSFRESGGSITITNVCHDITERERLYQALKKSEERFRLLSESAQDIIFSLDKKGRITYINPVVKEALGFDSQDIVGSYPTELARKKDRKLFVELFRRVKDTGELLKNILVTLEDRSGKEHDFLLNCSAVERDEGEDDDIAVVGMLKDITEQRRLERQLRQAQKMEAIGTLAGGIAHDFNNILASVIGYSELALIDLPGDCEARENIQHVLMAANRARDLVRQILSFSRQSEQERMPISIVPIVKEALKLLKASLPSTIRIVQEIDKDVGIIEADPTEIHQVLMNLCINAEHAMREKGGVLEVRLEKARMGKAKLLHAGHLQPGLYAKLTVTDTGHGMEQHVIDRIFDPYFTTKKNGEGTGLGLAVVHGIVKSYGGGIQVSSQVGKGTTFEIYFPAFETLEVREEVAETLLPMGYEAILFIDDEEMLAQAGRLMLEKLGYKVTTRTSGVEALELFEAEPRRFDLVITDLTMPNITGDKLASRILEIRPDIPIILCTGFSTKITQENAREMGISDLLMKPISMKELANVVRSVLDTKKSNGKR